jgi:hypothetical protein
MFELLLPLFSKVISNVFPDKEAQDAAKLKLMEMQANGELEALKAETAIAVAQANTNTEEAKSASLFVSGWRPSVGWVCSMGLVYTFMAQPLLSWYSLAHNIAVPPSLDMGTLITLLGGMLGLGGMRTMEKLQGVARK